MALTDLSIRNAKPAGKAYKLRDGGGLYIFVTTTGSKLWRLDYRHLDKHRTLSLGQYPQVTLQQARQKRLEAKQTLAQGRDPSDEKQAEKKAAKLAAANTFAALAEEYLVAVERQGLAPATMKKNKWILRELIIPQIGKRPIAEIRPAEILEVLSDIEASGRLETTRRARQLSGAVFRLAALTDRAPTDPTHLLRRILKAPKVESHPAIIHEASFGELLCKIDAYSDVTPIVSLALQFCAHTFPRPVEMRLAKWDDIDLEDSVWHIPAEHAKMRRPHDVPLAAAVRGILRKAAEVTGKRHGLIFCTPLKGYTRLSENTLNDALRRLGYGRMHTSHGFRSSASTILHERNYRSAVIETQLAHLERNSTKRAYNRAQYWDERVQLMNDWAKIIAELKSGASANLGSTEAPTEQRRVVNAEQRPDL